MANTTAEAGPAADRTIPPSWLRVRRLGRADRAALARHLIGLPPADRRARFGASPADETIRRHCEALNLDETVCFAALDETGGVVGAALGFACGIADGHGTDTVTGDRGRLIEVAVSVAPEHRRRGLGVGLVARVCALAAARGADAAAFEFEPGNAAIRGVVRHLGARPAPLADSCVIRFAPLR